MLFFFSSRRRPTRCGRDWSSDVCSSDLFTMIGSTGPSSGQAYIVDTFLVVVFGGAQSLIGTIVSAFGISQAQSTMEFFLSGRSEERRVGKECRGRWWTRR